VTNLDEALEAVTQLLVAVLVFGMLGYVAVDQINHGKEVMEPPFLTFAGGVIIGYLFGQRGIKQGIHSASDGVIAATNHVRELAARINSAEHPPGH
jgi:hypothetical protein